MQFTDIAFAVFLFVIFCLYWFPLRGRTRLQNVLLLVGSYIFYGWWDWRFLSLIFLTTLSTFVTALFARRRFGRLLTVGNIVLNIGILVCFKYLGFFAENLGRLFSLFGLGFDWFTVEVLVPVGISFYTFQAISYSVDVYKGRIEACREPLPFFTFISYFPQLVAGPIERASQLLPQIKAEREWDSGRASSGMRMIMFGLLKKLCVADILAIYVDVIFNGGEMSALSVLAGGLLFSFEIYCDFSAYSEIARGVSRLLGIELMVNFRFPYFSRNIPEFWRRWHISLMEWFRDYLYIPLGGSRKGNIRTALNYMAIFTLSGLWHGSAWNFVLWGVYWGLFSIFARFVLRQKVPKSEIALSDLPAMVATFGVVAFGFFLFRCSNMAEIVSGFKWCWTYPVGFGLLWASAWLFVRFRPLRIVMTALIAVGAGAIICLKALQNWPKLLVVWWLIPAALIAYIEWQDRNTDWPLQTVSSIGWRRMALYLVCIFFIAVSEPTEMAFIYFQF